MIFHFFVLYKVIFETRTIHKLKNTHRHVFNNTKPIAYLGNFMSFIELPYKEDEKASLKTLKDYFKD